MSLYTPKVARTRRKRPMMTDDDDDRQYVKRRKVVTKREVKTQKKTRNKNENAANDQNQMKIRKLIINKYDDERNDDVDISKWRRNKPRKKEEVLTLNEKPQSKTNQKKHAQRAQNESETKLDEDTHPTNTNTNSIKSDKTITKNEAQNISSLSSKTRSSQITITNDRNQTNPWQIAKKHKNNETKNKQRKPPIPHKHVNKQEQIKTKTPIQPLKPPIPNNPKKQNVKILSAATIKPTNPSPTLTKSNLSNENLMKIENVSGNETSSLVNESTSSEWSSHHLSNHCNSKCSDQNSSCCSDTNDEKSKIQINIINPHDICQIVEENDKMSLIKYCIICNEPTDFSKFDVDYKRICHSQLYVQALQVFVCKKCTNKENRSVLVCRHQNCDKSTHKNVKGKEKLWNGPSQITFWEKHWRLNHPTTEFLTITKSKLCSGHYTSDKPCNQVIKENNIWCETHKKLYLEYARKKHGDEYVFDAGSSRKIESEYHKENEQKLNEFDNNWIEGGEKQLYDFENWDFSKFQNVKIKDAQGQIYTFSQIMRLWTVSEKWNDMASCESFADMFKSLAINIMRHQTNQKQLIYSLTQFILWPATHHQLKYTKTTNRAWSNRINGMIHNFKNFEFKQLISKLNEVQFQHDAKIEKEKRAQYKKWKPPKETIPNEMKVDNLECDDAKSDIDLKMNENNQNENENKSNNNENFTGFDKFDTTLTFEQIKNEITNLNLRVKKLHSTKIKIISKGTVDTDYIAQNYHEFHASHTRDDIKHKIKRSVRLARNGQKRKALQALDSSKLADIHQPDIFDKVKALHPNETKIKYKAPENMPEYTLSRDRIVEEMMKLNPTGCGGTVHVTNKHLIHYAKHDDHFKLSIAFKQISMAQIQQRLPPIIGNVLFYAQGLPFGKEKNGNPTYGVRPIAICSAPSRFLDKLCCLNCTKEDITNAVGPYQLPNNKQALEKGAVVMDISDEMMMLDEKLCSVSTDASNAFNAISRHKLYDIICEKLPAMANVFYNCYGQDINVDYSHKAEHRIHHISGLIQGLTASTLYYNLGIWGVRQKVIEKMSESEPDFDIIAIANYIDDGIELMQYQYAVKYIIKMKEVMASYGLKVNLAKSSISHYGKSEYIINYLKAETEKHNIKYVQNGDREFLGIWKGSFEHVMTKFLKVFNLICTQLHYLNLFQDRQIKTSMLLSLFGVGKVLYIMKNLKWRIGDENTQRYESIIKLTQNIYDYINKQIMEGIPYHPTIKYQMQMKKSNGGMGLRQPKITTSAQRIVPLIQNLEKVEPYFPSLTDKHVYSFFLDENRINQSIVSSLYRQNPYFKDAHPDMKDNDDNINSNKSQITCEQMSLHSQSKIMRYRKASNYDFNNAKQILYDEIERHERKLNDFVAPSYEINVHSNIRQRDIFNVIDKKYFDLFCEKGTDTDKARLLSLSASGAMTALETPSNRFIGHDYSNQQYKLLLCYLMGAKVYNFNDDIKYEVCPKCGERKLDEYGVHAVNCSYGPHRIALHENIKHTLVKIVRKTNWKVSIEQKFNDDDYTIKSLTANERKLDKEIQRVRLEQMRSIRGRPGDIKISGYDPYDDITSNEEISAKYCDVTMINVVSPSYLQTLKPQEKRLVCGIEAAKRKREKYKNHPAFIPLAIENYGGLERNFRRLLQEVARIVSDKRKLLYDTIMKRYKMSIFNSLFSSIIESIVEADPLINRSNFI